MNNKWNIYQYDELQKRSAEIGSGEYLIDRLVRSLVLFIGDSGLGKSPFLYMASLCVTAGIPFLGNDVKRGRVLYLDFENGLEQVGQMIGQLMKYLKLPKAPKGLQLWNYNDCSEGWSKDDLESMIKDSKSDLVIIDSLTALYPDIETKNDTAKALYQNFRRLMRTYDVSILGVHHLKKPSENPKASKPSLEGDDWRNWFLQARGARALINDCDIRLGVDLPRKKFKKEAALAARGESRG